MSYGKKMLAGLQEFREGINKENNELLEFLEYLELLKHITPDINEDDFLFTGKEGKHSSTSENEKIKLTVHVSNTSNEILARR